jgi:hypothetical protein
MGMAMALIHGVVHQVLLQCVWYALVAALPARGLMHLAMEGVLVVDWAGKTTSQ